MNYIPSSPGPIAIVTDCPTTHDVQAGRPFDGYAGKFFDSLLSRAGIRRDSCFIGHVCQSVVPKDNLGLVRPDDPRIVDGLIQLRRDFAALSPRPNVVLALGRHALWAATGRWDLADVRGSIIEATGLDGRPKLVATYHPSQVYRQYEFRPFLQFDLKRVADESATPTIDIPFRDIRIIRTVEEGLAVIGDWRARAVSLKVVRLGSDIEGDTRAIQCIAFAETPFKAFVFPFKRLDGSDVWPDDTLRSAVIDLLKDPGVTKVWQNGLYDRFVWATLGHEVTGNEDDTMLQWWEWQNELRKGLAIQTSILTRQPYYKSDYHSSDQDVFYRYCGLDACVTLEISDKLRGYLQPGQTRHYRANHDLLEPLLYMQCRGIRYNAQLALDRLASISAHVFEWQARLDAYAREAGVLPPLPTTEAAVVELIGRKRKRPIMGPVAHKRTGAIRVKRIGSEPFFDVDPPKKEFAADWHRHRDRLRLGQLTPSQLGELAMWLGRSMNTKSPLFKKFLYDTLGLPKQWKKDPKTGEPRLTSDYTALLKIRKTSARPEVEAALELSRLRTRMQMLATPSLDGRMYCSYNIVGTESGRLSCRKSAHYVRRADELEATPE